MPYPYKPSASAMLVPVVIADVSTASTVRFAPGFNGRIRRISSSLGNAITVADSNITVSIGGSSPTAVTGGALVVGFSGSAAGDVDITNPTALNTFSPTDSIHVATDGGSTTASPLIVTLELEPI
jgi:hypothetical protein